MTRAFSRALCARLAKLAAGFCLALCSAGCEEAPDASAEPVNPTAFLWDSLWTVKGSFAEVDSAQSFPLPTDTALLNRLRYAESDSPPNDVLEGADITFEIDGRVLVRPAGADAAEYARFDYIVIDGALLRASIDKSRWFDSSYAYDEVPQALLLQPEPEAAPIVMGLVFDVVSRTLLLGDLESPAARIAELLSDDPRVPIGRDAFVYALVHGGVEEFPVRDAADVTAFLIEMLRETAVVGASASDADLESELEPIANDLLALDEAGIARTLVDRLAASDVVTVDVPAERVTRVLDLALYRRALDAGQALFGVRRLDLVFRRLP